MLELENSRKICIFIFGGGVPASGGSIKILEKNCGNARLIKITGVFACLIKGIEFIMDRSKFIDKNWIFGK